MNPIKQKPIYGGFRDKETFLSKENFHSKENCPCSQLIDSWTKYFKTILLGIPWRANG